MTASDALTFGVESVVHRKERVMVSIIKNLCSVLLLVSAPGMLFAGPVNINTADADTLAAELTGVGPALAAAIISDRQLNGPYANAEALMRVKGVGERIIELNRTNILVNDPPPATP
jgi:competence protein ComEA